ncbi:MAG: hypothetical protein ABIO69_04810, partial [Sphingomicrobium sp.]
MGRTIRIALKAALAALALAIAGCSTAPQQRVAPPPPSSTTPLPYRWTQGNAPQAYSDARALFGPLALRPGDYRWVAAIPQDGETRVVIDLLTQLFYVYRGDQ